MPEVSVDFQDRDLLRLRSFTFRLNCCRPANFPTALWFFILSQQTLVPCVDHVRNPQRPPCRSPLMPIVIPSIVETAICLRHFLQRLPCCPSSPKCLLLLSKPAEVAVIIITHSIPFFPRNRRREPSRKHSTSRSQPPRAPPFCLNSR